jgi:hypothetical protein
MKRISIDAQPKGFVRRGLSNSEGLTVIVDGTGLA